MVCVTTYIWNTVYILNRCMFYGHPVSLQAIALGEQGKFINYCHFQRLESIEHSFLIFYFILNGEAVC